MSELLTVTGVHWHSEGIFEISFERNGVDFIPGDCIALFGEDATTSRPYSMASGCAEDTLRFVIRRMGDGIDRKSLFLRHEHSPAGPGLKERFHGESVAEAGWMGQDERRGALRTGRGGPDPVGSICSNEAFVL
jgi:hypothetical protein